MKEWKETAIETVKEIIEWALISGDWSLDWCQVADEEIAICLWDLRELYYGFSFYFCVSFVVFLN